MSWAEEDWTVGLSGKVLQKVKELQVHHERLSRENKQKQLQLDNIQTSLEKQTAKYEEVRVELHSSHRELQKVQDEAKAALTSKERLSQDLQSKQAQVCSLEGQLDAARSLTNKLTQEVKRLEAELEKLQNSSSVETTLFSTPCWSASPWDTSGSRKEDRHGNREEGKSPGLHVRRLQFSEMPPSTSPRQHPSSARRLADAAPSAAFPWERDNAQPSARRPSAGPSPMATNGNALSRQEQRVKTNVSNQTEPVNELQIRLSDLEEELRVKMQMLNTIQNKVAQNEMELSAKESSLQRLRDELSQTQTRVTQERERASTAEQKAKHVQEELKCQRQNAESSRVQHQQRTKELEKQHQRDLQEFQKERQFMERQHQQDINKLNQELSQARAQHNVLQAQLEKESVHKQSLVKELDSLKEKLKWTEGQLQHSQKEEAQAQAKIVEASRETEALTASLKQSQNKEKSLEDDGRRLTEERDNARCLLRELQEQKAAIAPVQPLQICAPVQTFSNASLYQTRKPSPTRTAKQKGEEVNRPLGIKVPYPTDREPGEGIDSEHLSDNLFIKSEDLQREECESQTKREDVFEDVQTLGSQTISQGSLSKQKDLLAENAALHSELKDTREELQKRLDDLETQRRAETEARTRLKQLSRKNASQVTEKEEQYKECKSQLEKERSEVERLKKALAASETLTTREGEKCDEKNGEDNTVLQDKADEMIELNMELKKQLSEVKAQLVLEREERKQHNAEIMNKERADMEKIEGLQSEIEQLKASLNDSSQLVKGPGATNSPVTSMTLREDEDSDAVDNKPETLSSCMGNSQQNAMSLVLGDLIPDEGTTIDPQHPVLTVTHLEKEIQNQNMDEPLNNLESYDKLSSLESQVLSLQKQNALEKERAHEYQIKLEVLQNQVTQQTQQLTMAFEMQSKHISGLLTELQEKEEEMQLCRQELSVLKDQVGKDDARKRDRLEGPDISSTCPKSCFDGTSELTPAAQTPATADCQLRTQGLVNEANPMNLEETDLPKERFTEQELQSKMLSLQQENSLLQLKIKSITTQKVPGINKSCGSALKEQMPTVLSDVSVQTCTEAQQSGKEPGSQQLDQISYLQQQVVALQTKLQVLCEENQQKTEELAVWRLCSEPCALTEPQPVTLLREDEILLSCSSNKLQGRTLFSRLQTNQISEMKTLHPFSLLQEHNKNNSQSDKENTAPAPENQRDDGKSLCRGLEPIEDRVKSVGSQTEPELQPHAQEEVTEPEKEPVSATAAVHCSKDAISTAAFPISADPATLAERIRRSRAQLSAAFDDTEYEPYGLPEVVMKGFADIPTGPSCPYIVRRGLLGTAAVPVFPKSMADAEETD